MQRISKLQPKTPIQKCFKKIVATFHKEDIIGFMNKFMGYSIGACSSDFTDIRIYFYYYPVGSYNPGFLSSRVEEEKLTIEIVNDDDRKKDKTIEITDTEYKIKGFEYYKKFLQEYVAELLRNRISELKAKEFLGRRKKENLADLERSYNDIQKRMEGKNE